MSTNELEKKVDLHETSIQLINQKFDMSFSMMNKGLADLKEGMGNLQTSIDKGYVTKTQFESVRSDVEDLKSLKGWAIKIVFGAIIFAVLALIGLKP